MHNPIFSSLGLAFFEVKSSVSIGQNSFTSSQLGVRVPVDVGTAPIVDYLALSINSGRQI